MVPGTGAEAVPIWRAEKDNAELASAYNGRPRSGASQTQHRKHEYSGFDRRYGPSRRHVDNSNAPARITHIPNEIL
jgi:hypothetical protein